MIRSLPTDETIIETTNYDLNNHKIVFEIIDNLEIIESWLNDDWKEIISKIFEFKKNILVNDIKFKKRGNGFLMESTMKELIEGIIKLEKYFR